MELHFGTFSEDNLPPPPSPSIAEEEQSQLFEKLSIIPINLFKIQINLHKNKDFCTMNFKEGV